MSAEGALNDEQFSPDRIPDFARVKNSGLGRVRVLNYHGNGYFNTLDHQDRQRLFHRDSLTFLPNRKAKKNG